VDYRSEPGEPTRAGGTGRIIDVIVEGKNVFYTVKYALGGKEQRIPEKHVHASDLYKAEADDSSRSNRTRGAATPGAKTPAAKRALSPAAAAHKSTAKKAKRE